MTTPCCSTPYQTPSAVSQIPFLLWVGPNQCHYAETASGSLTVSISNAVKLGPCSTPLSVALHLCHYQLLSGPPFRHRICAILIYSQIHPRRTNDFRLELHKKWGLLRLPTDVFGQVVSPLDAVGRKGPVLQALMDGSIGASQLRRGDP